MAEENILLRVGIDQRQIKESQEAIVSARNEVDRLKEKQKELTEQYGKNSVEVVKNQAAIKTQNQIIRENERVLIANNKIAKQQDATTKENNGSIISLRESVKTLTAQYIGLTKEERENEQIGGQLQKRILAQTEELKKLEKQIGNTSRNVGNYKDDVKEAIAETGLFSGAIQTYTKAKKVATLATKSFGNALIATGIGAFLVLLGSLVTFLRETEEGSRAFRIALEAIGIVFGNLRSALAEVGGQLSRLFTEPQEALKDFGNLLLENITNRIKGILNLIPSLAKSVQLLFKGEFKEAGKVAADSILQVVTGVENATGKLNTLFEDLKQQVNEAIDDATKYVDKQRELAQVLNSLTVENARLNKESRAQEKISRDTTRSIEERLDALDKLEKIQEKQAANLLRQAQLEEKLLLLQIKNEGSFEARIQLEVQLAQAQARRINAETALQDVALKAEQTRQNLIKQGLEEEAKIREEKLSQELGLQKEQSEKFKQFLDQRLQDVKNTTEAEIEILKNQFIDGQISFEEYQQELTNIEQVALATRASLLEAQLEENEARFADQLQAIRENEELDAEQKIELELKLEQDRLAIQQSLQDQLTKINKDGLEQRFKDALEAKKLEEQLAKDLAAAEILARESVLEAAKNVFGEQSAAGKIAASFQALISTFTAATEALKIPFPFGQIVAASITASGLANVAKINSQQAPKFAEGGGIEVSGPSHSGGGVDVALGGQTVANVEGGEGLFVMKKDAFQSLKALSNYNQMFGGNSWFGGGKKFLADGGAISRSSVPQIDRRSLQDTQNGIGEALRQINVITKVTDINRVSDEMKLVEMQGDLR